MKVKKQMKVVGAKSFTVVIPVLKDPKWLKKQNVKVKTRAKR